MDRKEPTAQPDLEDVVALYDGELEPGRAERVRRALRDDPELARAGLDAVDPDELAAVAGMSPADVDRAWARFQAGLAAEDPAVVPFPSPRRERSVPLRQLVWAIAATLLVGVGLGVLLTELRRAPSTDGVLVARLDLVGDGGPLRGEEDALVVDADVDRLVLLLTPPSSLYGDLPPRVRYRLSRAGVAVAEGEAREQAVGSYAVSLRSADMSSAEYLISLFRSGEPTPFAEYRFAVDASRR